MIDKIQISAWDLLVYIMCGMLAALVCTGHLLILGMVNLQQLAIVPKIPTSMLLLVLPAMFYFIGLVVEPVANVCEKNISRPIRDRYKLRHTEIASQKYAPLEKHVAEHMLPKSLRGQMSTYFWCKDYIVQNGFDGTFMVFLGKFGFYRSASFIFFVNGVIVPLLHGLHEISLASMVGSFIMSYCLANRAIDFYGHMAGAVYRNYLLSHYEQAPSDRSKKSIPLREAA